MEPTSTPPVAEAGPGACTLRASGVSHRFGDVAALEGVDLELADRRRLAIVGRSGCGKSTLLRLIAGLDEPTAGTITIGPARAAAERVARCALMPQSDLLLPWRTALDNACVALENRGVPRREARDLARPLFRRFGLAEFEGRRPAELSGGMRQRIAFLRTLMPRKDVLLLDEPFGALDSITRGEMQEWFLAALRDDPRTVLLVTHDVDEALLLGEQVVVLSARPGRVVRRIEPDLPQGAPRREIVTSPAFAAVKQQVLEALGC